MNPDWRQRMQARLDVPPAVPRLPLALAIDAAAPQVIGSIESGLALELTGAGIALRNAGQRWQIEIADALSIDPALAQIADRLRAIGRASAWRDELLDVCTLGEGIEGRRLGAIERAAVRPLGIASRAVHLVVSDARGGVWVQQRALDKAVDPGLWDTTVGGLVASNESIADTLARETWEEAGLRREQLHQIEPFGRFTVRRPLPEGYMVERIEMFEAVAAEGAMPANQDGEVAGFECLDRPALIARLEADSFTLEAGMILASWLDRHVDMHL